MTYLSVSYHIPSFQELGDWSMTQIIRWLPIFDGQYGTFASPARTQEIFKNLVRYHKKMAGDVNDCEGLHALGYWGRFIYLTNQMIADSVITDGERDFLLQYKLIAVNDPSNREAKMSVAAMNELMRRTFSQKYSKTA
jgi:hypothetical protein